MIVFVNVIKEYYISKKSHNLKLDYNNKRMEKLNQGEKLTVEYWEGYSWKNILYLFVTYIFYVYLLVNTENDNIIFTIISLLFYISFSIFIFIYPLYPKFFHTKQYKIFFFKEYLLLENFDKSMENYELSFFDIKRIYSNKNGFISIEIIDSSEHLFKNENLRNLKLENKFNKNTNEITDYLNSQVENFKSRE